MLPAPMRLVFVVGFLLIQLKFKPQKNSNHNKNPANDQMDWVDIRLARGFLAIFLMEFVLAISTFRHAREVQKDMNPQCSVNIDGDLAGVGVRSALWVQQGLMWLLVISGAALIRPRKTACKEFATGLVIAHLSLAIAVVVQMQQQTLSPLDAAVGTMMLDAQNLGVSVALSSRDMLAARWAVVVVSISQFLGLVVIGVIMARFDDGLFAAPNCNCFSFFWWVWKSTCVAVSAIEHPIFWIYYASRWLLAMRNWHFSISYM
ncbi:hypothetical protein B0T24DRAFT_594676 [Lasiosphaeria ovina]|uniref:Uncharacterized protein n=1 Tax=Lasiosphaeria ovina TaxID=92902 RepID=A0AAE0N4T4_9PEZI|nr:hypothetical protein B0T24DRAFT_594676 [Lasiosphaeria ovina]